VHSLRRSAAIGLAMLLMLVLAAPTLAKGPGGNSTAAKACQDGGFRHHTDEDGAAFSTVGDCVRYAARGGEFIAVVVDEPLSIELAVEYWAAAPGMWSTRVEWSGLEPASKFVIRWDWGSAEYLEIEFGSLNAAGEGSWEPPFSFACFDEGSPLISAVATATPAGGTQQTYPVPLPTAACAS
jgi:hypothetical protein